MNRWILGAIMLTLAGFGCKSGDPDPSAVVPGTPPPVMFAPAMDGEAVSSPFTLSGFIHPTVEHYEWRILTQDGTRLMDGFLTLGERNPDGYAPYSQQIFLPVFSSPAFLLQIVQIETSDTMPVIAERKLTVRDEGKTSVSLFFVDEGDGDTCVASGYEKRTLGKTVHISELAMTELLKGSQKNFRTEIPDGTTLGQVIIEDGIATVNLNSENEAQWSGGSCHVNLIRSQITQTLMQMEGVTDVVVTVNGKTDADGILQP